MAQYTSEFSLSQRTSDKGGLDQVAFGLFGQNEKVKPQRADGLEY
jgi:hypothetical protein